MPSIAEIYGSEARERIELVQRGLRELSAMLAKAPGQAAPSGDEFELQVDAAPPAKPAKEKTKRKK
jgi:hypothetical protein